MDDCVVLKIGSASFASPDTGPERTPETPPDTRVRSGAPVGLGATPPKPQKRGGLARFDLGKHSENSGDAVRKRPELHPGRPRPRAGSARTFVRWISTGIYDGDDRANHGLSRLVEPAFGKWLVGAISFQVREFRFNLPIASQSRVSPRHGVSHVQTIVTPGQLSYLYWRPLAL